MQDIFLSRLPKLINGWVEAFPDALLAKDISGIAAGSKTATGDDLALIFWLHTNNDQENWLADTIATVLKSYPGSKIVLLTNAPTHAESLLALSAGAMGYAHSYSPPEMLREIRSVVTHGGIWLGQQLLKRLIETSLNLTGSKPEFVEELLQRLTSRERQVALEAAKGLSNKEIARVLAITERTVKAHLAATFERLGAKDRLQLALMLNKR
jgi:DNA-binding NarL/FixJ family response regulator